MRVLAASVALLLASALPLIAAEPKGSAAKEDRPLLLVHYMPWYAADPAQKKWGWHWTMNKFQPGHPQNGQLDIASHYHPSIGVYDSGDQHVLEYHAGLMRLSGIDGIIVDWYGRTDYLDYGLLHRNTSAMIEQVQRAGLKFSICYEDQTITKLQDAGRLKPEQRVSHAREEIAWLQQNWFRSPAYVQLDQRPLLLSFGYDGLKDAEWEQLLGGLAEPVLYLSEHHRRPSAAGAFDWPLPKQGLQGLKDFETASEKWPTAMPVAFPRFHDVYAEAGLHPSWGRIDDDQGKTFVKTLSQAIQSHPPAVQIATWNDWGEGTMIEPSTEFGMRDLIAVQRARKKSIEPGFPCAPEDLQLPGRLLKLRRADLTPERQIQLDQAAAFIAARDATAAKEILNRLEKGL
ncbi:glycoside hydrolase family 71/99-like protein [Planctomicrobium piriforme]|uniref:Glycosyl hydrolase family 99 n=1 Tax=Planctomicrobium piriforme TaxID=1576369 RepID=A0A1I3GME5_9PLAN|nr:glycoside hydrolase family 71/99-like protein [Planctomicrobium piriforme]SFI24665.1 Glycosyl hydrolase family 99 [Planctomicrobium piriforme]